MNAHVNLLSALVVLTGCAGPIGPPFGLGPDADYLFGVLVVLLLACILYRSANGHGIRHLESSAAHILSERYALGELTREEFKKMMRDLSAP